jgi:hypothetical protein
MMANLLAYIDPGSGSIILQILIGSIFGASFFFRQKLAGLCRLFRKND